MLDVGRHPGIEIMSYSDVIGLSGECGDFTVTVNKKPRYVREDLCTACGRCVEKCPGKAPDAFELGLAQRKAIYLYFPQGIPSVYTIDPKVCLKLTKDRCGTCQKLCEQNAIDFEMEDEEVELSVGAIIVAVGLTPFNPTVLTHYGYGRLPNVISGMEYERLINASGPTHGHLERPSDHKLAKKVAYIQCAGSRDLRHQSYCSSVCCMYAIKDAMLAREHDEESESYIFHTDFRTVGKWFEKYKDRGERDYGINYIRGRVAEITEDEDHNPVIWYEDTRDRTVSHLTVDMAVLAIGAAAAEGLAELARILGIELTECGFVKTDPSHPADTSVPCIFACGYCRGPADISESVFQASAAAERAAEVVFATAER